MSPSAYRGLPAFGLLFVLAVAPAQETESASRDSDRNRRLLKKWKTDAEHYARLRRDLRAFWALPESKRRQLRQLDKEMHDLDAKTRQHLWKTAERYAAWLQRLPEDERRRIETTTDPQERLALIRYIKEKQWIERLPQKVREELDKLSAEERKKRVAQMRQQERKQRKQWFAPKRKAGEKRPAKKTSTNKQKRGQGK